MSENGEIYTAGNKFYTPAGTDGMDKFHLWLQPSSITSVVHSSRVKPKKCFSLVV